MAVVKDFNGNKLTFQGSKKLSDVVQFKIFDTPRQYKLLVDVLSGKRTKTTSIEV